MPLAWRQRPDDGRRVDALQSVRLREPVDEFDRQVEDRDLQKLVVKSRQAKVPEQCVERDGADAVQRTKDYTSQIGAWRRRRIGEQQMHPEEDGDRNI